MADEITVTISASLTNGAIKRTRNPGSISITQNSKGAHLSTWLVGLTAEDWAPSDFGSNGGLVFLRNALEEDPSNPTGHGYVKYGPSDSGTQRDIGRIYPGETACFRLAPGVTLRATAVGQIVPLDVIAFKD